MKRSTEYSIILLLIFVSLLIHMSGLLFTLFKAPSAQTIAQQKMDLKLPAFKDNRQAAMQARKSNFGAPVVFKNITPQPQQKQSPKQPSITPKEKKPAVAKTEPQETETKPKRIEIKQTTFVELKKSAQSKVTKKQKSSTPEEPPVCAYPGLQARQASSGYRQKEVVKKPIEQLQEKPEQEIVTKALRYNRTSDKPQAITPAVAKAMARKQDERMEEKNTQKPKVLNKQTPPSQKQVTLASLASGFLSHMKDKGRYDITMEGDPSKVPNQEQLNIAQYGKKLLWQVQNSYRINKHMLYNLPKNITADFIIGVSIPRNGIGATCQLLQSTGSALVDSCLLFIYQQATTALPPVPSCITQQPLRISVRDRTDTTKFKQRNNLAFSGSRRRFGP